MLPKAIARLVITLMVIALPVYAQATGMTVKKRSIIAHEKAYDIEAYYPLIGNAKIDAIVARHVQDIVAGFKKESEPPEQGQQKYELNISYTVARNDNRMFVVTVDEWSFTGGAHGNGSSTAFNFMMPDAARVELTELVEGQRAISRISQLAIPKIVRSLCKEETNGNCGEADLDMDWIRRGAGPNARNFASFEWLPDRLHLTFDSYQVGPYVAGPQEVEIPMSQLAGFIRPNWRAPAPSFDCKRAASPTEKAVCSDVDLARLDRHVAEAYLDKLTWASDATATEKLKKDQRDWLIIRDQSCGGNVTCLKASYTKRQAAIR